MARAYDVIDQIKIEAEQSGCGHAAREVTTNVWVGYYIPQQLPSPGEGEPYWVVYRNNTGLFPQHTTNRQKAVRLLVSYLHRTL